MEKAGYNELIECAEMPDISDGMTDEDVLKLSNQIIRKMWNSLQHEDDNRSHKTKTRADFGGKLGLVKKAWEMVTR